MDVPLGAALPAGPDEGALEGEDFSWVVGAAGVFCCREIEVRMFPLPAMTHS